MSQNRDLVQRVYEAFAIGDIPSVLGFLSADVHWPVARCRPEPSDFVP